MDQAPPKKTTNDTNLSMQDTMAASPSLVSATVVSSGASMTNSARYTTLPRIEMEGLTARLTHENKDRYQPVKLLGRGGAGEVNLVQDQDIIRPIAMKRILPGHDSPEMLYRFAREVRTVGQLEHPNIIPIHDVGRDESGDLYFTMKYVDGETLEAIIKKLQAGDAAYHERFSFEARTEIFLGILNALSFAHAKGILHRDIKPANIMVGPYGEVVVMDWGIAKPLSKDALPDISSSADVAPDPSSGDGLFMTHQGALVGTPAYMSPEQARGKNRELDVRSDIYSVCVLFYELLTLRHYLHDKKNVRTMLIGVLNEEPALAYSVSSPYQSAVPAELSHFVRKGIEKDPSKRYQSVQEMITRLQNNREGELEIQCSSTFVKRASYGLIHLVDRHPTGTAGALSVLGLALLVGVVWGVLQVFV